MRISLGNTQAKLTHYTDLERIWLTEYLTFRSKGKSGREITHRMYEVITDTFPAGLVPVVVRVAEEEGFAVEVVDPRSPPSSPDEVADVSWLYDYQLEAVEEVEERTRGIVRCPTGSGKTEIAIALAKRLNNRWLFLVHRKTLLNQTAERFTLRAGEEAGMIGEGVWKPSDWFTVATFQTVYKALKRKDPRAVDFVRGIEGVVVDECHVLPASSFWKVAMTLRNAYWRIGLSGTPLQRGDRRNSLAVAALGPIIYRIKPTLLIDRGMLAKPQIHLVPCEQTSNAATWPGIQRQCIVRSAKRNGLLTKLVKRAEKPSLVFVKQLRHGRELALRLEKAGLRVAFAEGKHSVVWRENLIRSLERGSLDALVCTVIFQEGVDIPSLRSVVVGSGGKSIIEALQRIGRGMRTDQGRKMQFDVWDVKDSGHRLLERHSMARIKSYTSEGYETTEEIA
jgi:superfamily II DNA or RNA helicase